MSLSCSRWSSDSANILVIAVDQLRPSDLGCLREGRPPLKSGLEELCQSSVRFSHAYSPVPMTVPALATLLTGLFPFQHGVRDNGSTSLSTRMHSVAQYAYRAGYQTALFSGGAPVLRNTGLQQGFVLFDDTFAPTAKKPFRGSEDSFSAFLNWEHGLQEPFFALVYLPDLGDVRMPTRNELGESRNLSVESQIEELDTQLGRVLQTLRREKKWDNTQIVLVGLMGRQTLSRKGLIGSTNLMNEGTQVALLLKPSGKPRDQGVNWSFDKNVSLADVGQTLWSWVKADGPATNPLFVTTSLAPLLRTGSITLAADRWIPFESLWEAWQGGHLEWSGLRQEYRFFLRSKSRSQTQITQFQSSTDHLELSPTHVANNMEAAQALEPYWQQLDIHTPGQLSTLEVNTDKRTKDFDPVEMAEPFMQIPIWQKSNERIVELHNLANLLQVELLEAKGKKSQSPSLLDQGLYQKLTLLLAHIWLKTQDWNSLGVLGQLINQNDWTAIASRNQHLKGSRYTNICLQALTLESPHMATPEIRLNCRESHLEILLDSGLHPADDAFKKILAQDQENQKILRLWEWNWALGLVWSISEQKFNEALLWELAMADPLRSRWRSLNSPSR